MSRSRCNIANVEQTRSTDFGSQYFKTYCTRLACVVGALERQAVRQWGSVKLQKLCDVVPDERCVVIGTVFKELVGRPSVIKELAESHQQQPHGIVVPAARVSVASAADAVYLEDSQQRIRLDGVDPGAFVTGISVAVVGRELDSVKGRFVVDDVAYATPQWPQRALSAATVVAPAARFIAVVSGLQLDSDAANVVAAKLFFDWLCGVLPVERFRIDPRSVGRLIVAGDSVAHNREDRIASQNKFVIMKSEVHSAASMTLLDVLLSGACRSVPVDVMSGPQDPTSVLVPQKPMHPVMFPRSRQWATFQSRPNPWMFYLENGGGLVIGTAGQTIDDIDRYSSIADPLDRLAATVKWGHLAPTAPDTLPSYPNSGAEDPLVMPHTPALYFAGNQDRFDWRVDGAAGGDCSMLVAVPRFKETGKVVLVDLVDKVCHSISFK